MEGRNILEVILVANECIDLHLKNEEAGQEKMIQSIG